MCLWNAGKDTWRALGLKREQVRRMDELRALYPAVVNGQWGNDPEPGAVPAPQVGTPVPDQMSGPHPSSSVGQGQQQALMTAAPVRPASGLQDALRALLTLKQLRTWDRLCNLH